MSQAQPKVALVTGSATGIGRAVALRFAKQGIAVAVNYSRSEKEAKETLADVQKLGVPAILCQCNVADEPGVRRMVERCVKELGGLDILVNNAAMTRFIDHANLEALTGEVWDEILGVNLKGAYFCCREAIPVMKSRGGGAIVNVSSAAGVVGHGSSIAYAASKAALNCMTKSLARAFAPAIRVNAVAPGPVVTRWLADHMDHVEKQMELTPMKRPATTDDIADVVAFLATGTSLITGQIVLIDGGRTM
jgi:NAD(P)-dependent dehydrogenase (short-subunit alcohol dehydrogenase family)